MIAFSSAGASAVRRSARGSVAVVSAGVETMQTFKALSEAENAGLSADDLRRARLCFLGGPAKLTFVPLGEDAHAALTLAAQQSEGGWLCAPDIASATAVAFVKARRLTGDGVRAVVADALAPDSAGIVNLCMGGLHVNLTGESESVSADDYACRIAGTLAGLSLSQSATYLPLAEITAFDASADPDADIDAGKLIICQGTDGPRLGRAVTSLTTVAAGQSAELKKIKIAEAVDMIRRDIRATFEKDYIGKAMNDYDSKLLLVTAINGYLASLAGDVLDRRYDNRAYVDFDAQRVFLMGQGVDVDNLSETEILTANTDSHVFLAAALRFVDAMEDLTFRVSM
jgi:hypothetical protein